MIDAAFSHQRHREDRAESGRRRLLIPMVAAFIFIGAGLSLVWGFGGAGALAPSPNVVPSQAREQVSNELIETAKGLEVTQQAVDQLQIVQDQLAAQKAETKKLSEQISAVTEKLDALQGSIANIPAPSVASPVSQPKSRRQ
jgi:septal ring factor EnvC (AmiA/AmiB activator)